MYCFYCATLRSFIGVSSNVKPCLNRSVMIHVWMKGMNDAMWMNCFSCATLRSLIWVPSNVKHRLNRQDLLWMLSCVLDTSRQPRGSRGVNNIQCFQSGRKCSNTKVGPINPIQCWNDELTVLHQCRRGCPYEGNEVAFVASAIWSAAALLAFLRFAAGR